MADELVNIRFVDGTDLTDIKEVLISNGFKVVTNTFEDAIISYLKIKLNTDVKEYRLQPPDSIGNSNIVKEV